MENDIFQRRRAEIERTLSPGIIAEPLLSAMADDEANQRAASHPTIIELNTVFPGGLSEARSLVVHWIDAASAHAPTAPELFERTLRGGTLTLPRPSQSDLSSSYVFATLTAGAIRALVAMDGESAQGLQTRFPVRGRVNGGPHHELRAIFRIWDSPAIGPLITDSIRTVKADAAQRAFAATGSGIVWAVIDSGIDGGHPHFVAEQNLVLPPPLQHRSFIDGEDPLNDGFGHGTHVAGIIAGRADPTAKPCAAVSSYAQDGDPQFHLHDVSGICAMAPACKLLSLRVLDDTGNGRVDGIIQALEYVNALNAGGKNIVVHGVNISVGYPFDGRWYGCGHTPICEVVNRLVRTGVVVVVAAGNTGHVLTLEAQSRQYWDAGQSMSINDPGNADLALTVGSVHRVSPHTFGVSYFSSKGPTGDGRRKPDVVAPGEHIISAATGANVRKVPQADIGGSPFEYVEDTGTSMAAPHVSGILAAFLSIRPEWIGQALELQSLARNSALDLKRDANIQGAGLVDLMRLIQSV